MIVPIQIRFILRQASNLPSIALTIGFALLVFGFAKLQIEPRLDSFDHATVYEIIAISVLLSVTVTIATLEYINKNDFVDIFILNIYLWGSAIEGAVGLRIFNKLYSIVWKRRNSESQSSKVSRGLSWIRSKFTDLMVLWVVRIMIISITIISIISAIGSSGFESSAWTALRQFWLGVFFLGLAGTIYAYRHFAHKIGWITSFGLVLCVTGSVLYNFQTQAFIQNFPTPYLVSPIPDILSSITGFGGFAIGALLWTYFTRIEQAR